MPENSSKTQTNSDSKPKSRLPNKTLTSAEVTKKSEKTAEKSSKKTTSESIPVKTKPSKKPSKASSASTTTVKVIKASSEKPKPPRPKAPAPAPTRPMKTKKAPSRGKTLNEVKAQSAKQPAKNPKSTSQSEAKSLKTQKITAESSKDQVSSVAPSKAKASIAQEPKVPKTHNTKNKSTKSARQKNFSFLSIFSKVIAIILGFSSLFFIGMIAHLDVLPTKYLLLAILLIVIIAGGCGLLLAHQKTKAIIKVPVNIIAIIFSCVYLVGGGYIAEASGFLDSLKPVEYVSEQYYLIVKNDSVFQDIKDLKNKTVGTFDEGIELYREAVKKLNDTISANLEPVKSIHAMTEGVLSGEFDAAFLSAAHKTVIDEDSAEFSESTRILYTIEVKVKADSVDEAKVNVTSEPFTVYISGNDSYGDLTARGLSDVNMLVTVNPVTHEVLLTSIPRDCFVQLHGTTGGKDKLTHAGLYGVQMSILTIEDLLDINIDYYVKINFPALVNLVDAIGGIDVYSDKTFKPRHDSRMIHEGTNHFDGKLALAFARERMAYSYGDRHRVQNQRDVLNAIIQKVSGSPVILTKTNEILNSLSSNLDTNISKSEISSLVKLQLDHMPSWQIGEYMINGSDLYTYTYTFGDQLRYVMPPFPESIQAAHDYITGIMEGKSLKELNIPEPEKSWK